MTRIVLTEEQARMLNPTEEVQICDPRGHIVVVIPPELSPEEFAQLRRAKDSKGPRVTGEQAHQMLQALEEVRRREGPLSKDRAMEIVNQVRAARGA